MNYTLTEVVDTNEGFLGFLKTRSHLYHQSNAFFRDFHYGIIAYGETKGKKISYGRAESLAKELVSSLEHAGLLRRITPGSWMLNYPEFRKPSSKIEAASKPSSGLAVANTAIATPSSGSASQLSSGNSTHP
jgi:hypothetical protein